MKKLAFSALFASLSLASLGCSSSVSAPLDPISIATADLTAKNPQYVASQICASNERPVVAYNDAVDGQPIYLGCVSSAGSVRWVDEIEQAPVSRATLPTMSSVQNEIEKAYDALPDGAALKETAKKAANTISEKASELWNLSSRQ